MPKWEFQNLRRKERRRRLKAEGKTTAEIEGFKERSCINCGQAFVADKRQRTCSRICGRIIRRKERIFERKHLGYIYVYKPEHPAANSGGYIAKHRLIMESTLGRLLKPFELVHHRNQIKDDNSIENLEIVMRKLHFGQVNCPKCDYEFKVK